MGLVADDAAIAKRFVFKHKLTALLAVAGGALLVQTRECHSARRLHDVRPMRIVALRATHLVLDDRMVVRQAELGVRVLMAVETKLLVLARMYEATADPAHLDMLAAWAMAGFTTAHVSKLWIRMIEVRVRVHRELPNSVCVAIYAGGVADEMSAFNFGQDQGRAVKSRAGRQDKANEGKSAQRRTENPFRVRANQPHGMG